MSRIGGWLARVGGAAGRVLMEASVRHLAGRAEKGISIEEVRVNVNPAAEAREISVLYCLRAERTSSASSLIFDLRGSPLALAGVTSGVVRDTDQGGLSPLVQLQLAPGETWDGATVSFTFRLPERSKPRYFVAPDWLPRVISTGAPQKPFASEKVIVDRANAGLLLVGSIRERPDADFAQVVLALDQSAAIDADRTSRAFVAPALLESLSTGEVERLYRLLGRCLEFLAHLCGVNPAVQLVIVPPNDLAGATIMPYGALIVASPQQLGVGTKEARSADFALAHRLAGVWWGGGCRIAGAGAAEIEGGLRGALALLWVEALGEEDQLRKALVHIRELTRRGAVRDFVRGAEGYVRRKPTAANTLALYEGLRDNPSSQQMLERLTRSYWAHYLPAALVRDSFAAVGITLRR